MSCYYLVLVGVIWLLKGVQYGTGQATEGCGRKISSQAGTIVSPNYPDNYPDPMTCTWTITVAENQIITLKFHNFDVDDSDTVTFYDGDNSNTPVINGQQTGYWPDSQLSEFRVRTSGHSLHIVFNARGPPSGPGFTLSYWAHECPPLTHGVDYCDQNCTCDQEGTSYCNPNTAACVCKSGWRGTYCHDDVNECANSYICSNPQTHCVNTPGSFSCVCKAGLRLNSNGQCVSSCTTEPSKCSHLCGVVSTNPYKEQCSCPNGKQLNSTDNQTCDDCKDWHYGEDCKYLSNCNRENTRYLNVTNGLCSCYLNWTSTDCNEDFNECTITTSCNSTYQDCVNTRGSHECRRRPEVVNTTMCNECINTLTNTTGIISFDYYSTNCFNNNYNKIKQCSWVIEVQSNHVIDLRFTHFQLSSSSGYVRIYDGRNGTAPLLGHFDGYNYSNSRLPSNYVRSSGHQMYIVRIDDFSGTFVATYSSHECKTFSYDANCSTPCNCSKNNTDYCDSITGLCMCKPQWTSHDCTVDINECLLDPLTCPDYSDCNNLQPGYQCVCKAGLEKNNQGQCVESASSSSACLSRNCSHKCVNLNESREEHCYCPIGMDLHRDLCLNCSNWTFGPDCSRQCSCVKNKTASCNSVTGQCACLPGWTHEDCSQDIDECSLHTYSCPSYSSCRNTPGDYDCACDRNYGVENVDHRTCKERECNHTLTSYAGMFTSPNYPSNYYNLANCTWLISVNENNDIIVRFQDFVVENGRDLLFFYDGNNAHAIVIRQISSSAEAQHAVRSTGNTMFINFITDGSGQHRGFKATYISHRAPSSPPACILGDCSQVCDHLNQTENHCFCRMGVELQENQCPNCSNGTLAPECSLHCPCVQNHTDLCNPVTGQCLCLPGWTADNCSEDVDECYFELDSCPTYSSCSNFPGGFDCNCDRNMGVENVDHRTCRERECNQVLTNSTGTIASPNYPNSYYNRANCTWLISVREGDIITLRLEAFHLENGPDFVIFYNGNSTRGSIISRFTSYVQTPRLVRSSGNTMFINFASNSNYANTGFSATYHSHPCRSFTFGENCTEYCHCNREHTQFCHNIKGECLCKAGWKGNTCSDDVDECQGTNIKLCPSNSNCHNTLGSYECRCHRGFMKNIVTQECDAYDGCYDKKCSYACYRNNVNDIEQCTCPDGFVLDVSGLVCVVPYYPYGQESNDNLLSSEKYGQKLNQGTILVSASIYLTNGAPFGNSEKLINVVFVMSNGLIVLGVESKEISGSPNLPYASSQEKKIVAPFWADIDPNSGHVNYHLYEKCGQSLFDGINDDENSPSKAEVMTRASQDVIKYYNLPGFEVDSALVVTWVGVQHFSQNLESNTFQAVFISGWKKDFQKGREILSEEETSYVIFLYQQGQMNWTYVAGRLINIGFTGNIMADTDSAFVSTLDKVKGNTGYNGVFTYQTGRSNSSLQKCHRYTCNNVPLLSDLVYENEKRALYKCPCTIERLGHQWQLFETRGTNQDIKCYAISNIAKNRFLPGNTRNKLCCYKTGKPQNPNDWRDVEQTRRAASYVPASPESGHVLIYEPWQGYYYNVGATQENIEAHTTCCAKSTKELCDRFYKIFPDMGCTDFVVFVTASALGDPHITTLDGVTYTMNGWGEYILMDIKSKNFTLQARTSRVETSKGTTTNATVFTSFAAKETGYAHFQVDLGINNKTMVIYANGVDLTNIFYKDPANAPILEEIVVTREDTANKTFVIASFPCGVSIKVSVGVKSLDIEVQIDRSLENKTLGLLGNFNRNKSDEFTLPNGVVRPSNMSEREIFYLFGKEWEVTAQNTVFVYGKRENSSTYQHSDFVPMFGDEASPETVAMAEAKCSGNNTACVIDFMITNNAEFAMSTKESSLKFESLITHLDNSPPELSLKNESLNSFGHWVVFNGKSATLEVVTEDDDGDEVFIETVETPADFIVSENNITYSADVSRPTKLGLRAKDSNGAYSPIVYVTIAVCTGCNGHGVCTNNTRNTGSTDGYFQIFKCNCFPAYTGVDCESELNACASKPCSVGQECTDLTAAQQGNNVTGYVCGSCPSGYTNLNGKCVDVDECSNNNISCQHNCINTEGSFTCSCRNGYRLDTSDKKTCKDVNECEEQTSQCQHRCINTEGSYNCSCNEGYDMKPDGYSCELSITGFQRCTQCQHTCVFNKINNTATCECNNGFLLDPKNKAECIDIDECQNENMPCSQKCINTDGNFYCHCYHGFQLQSDTVSCMACEVPFYGENCNKTCDCNGRGSCNNVKGCVCNDNWTGVNCVIDVNECDIIGSCPDGQFCENTNGSFTCSCPNGYFMDGTVCKDIIECSSLQTNLTCNLRREICVNTIGSYRCECKHGYARDDNSVCQDIDECNLGGDRCQHLCHNVEGSYNCECRAGYVLAEDRHSCINVQDLCKAAKLNCTHGCSLDDMDKLYCICPRGYILIGSESCEDINECNKPENNSCSHKDGCINTDGGYTCSCPPGAKLDNDGRNCLSCTGDTWGIECGHDCVCGIGAEECDPKIGCICKTGYTGEHCSIDINECTTGNLTCKAKEVCVNIPGSATCQCLSGFQKDLNGSCVDINECSGKNNCTQLCTNTEGSYSCSCYDGYTYNLTRNKCLDMDECILGKHQCDEICTNTEGSYRCSCPLGLYLQRDGVSCGANIPCINTTFCGEICANINGTDTCFCGKGKILATDNVTCHDVDLCEQSSCTEGCVETKGNTSYECLCNAGKYLASDGITCTECIEGKYGFNCSSSCSCDMSHTETCDKLLGTCKCKNNWRGVNCVDDVDECATNSRTCQEHSHCVNTNGSSFCACNDGYLDRNQICIECDDNFYGPACLSRCSCGEHYNCNKTNGACYCKPVWSGDNCEIDINECNESLQVIHNCSSTLHEVCSNTEGGYQCNCDVGYTKSCDSCRCEDIDECTAEQFVCKNNSHCVNTKGSYLCKCDIGYLEEKNQCKTPPLVYTFPSTITLNYNASGVNLTNETFITSVQTMLTDQVRDINPLILSVNIIRLSQGSLIVESSFTMATNSTTDKSSELSLANTLVEMMQREINITIDNQVVRVVSLKVSETEILMNDKPCDIRIKISPCSHSEICEENGKVTVCKYIEVKDSQNLIIGLSVGVSLFVILFATIGIVIYCWSKKNRGKEKIDGRQPKELFESKHTNRSEGKSEDTQSDKTYDSIENPSWHNSVLSYHHPITRVASPTSLVTSAAPFNDGMNETKYRGQPLYADYRDLKKVKATSYHL